MAKHIKLRKNKLPTFLKWVLLSESFVVEKETEKLTSGGIEPYLCSVTSEATHSSILGWEILWTGVPGGPQILFQDDFT